MSWVYGVIDAVMMALFIGHLISARRSQVTA